MAFVNCLARKKSFIVRLLGHCESGARIHRNLSLFQPCRSAVDLAYASYESSDEAAQAKTPRSSPVVIMHGLFGSKSNWNTLAKVIHRRTGRKVIAIDARNHGDSPHSSTMTYAEMAKDLKRLLESLEYESAILVGHSMGGSTMMCAALNYPRTVEKLVVVDMSPIRTSASLAAMSQIFDAMLGVEIKNGMSLSETRKSIDRQLERSIRSDTLRQFLLMNLVEYEPSKYRWRVNLPILAANFTKEIATFPKLLESHRYEGPTLFIGGGNSDYIRKEDHTSIRQLFPMAKFRYIEGAGHWVQTEKPAEFLDTVVEFIDQK